MPFSGESPGPLCGLDVGDEGKGGREDDTWVLEALEQCWCCLQR